MLCYLRTMKTVGKQWDQKKDANSTELFISMPTIVYQMMYRFLGIVLPLMAWKKSAHNWPRLKLSPKCLTKPDCPWYQFSAVVKEVFRNSEHLGLYSQYPRYEGTSPRQRAGAHLRQRPFCQISEALVTQTLVPIGLQWAVSSFRHTWTWCLKATTSGERG